MKFRTEIESSPATVRIGYENRILALGSCFATQIAGWLSAAKFSVTANPTGILFNPLSIAAAIRSFATPVEAAELRHDGERWFHYAFHGDFSAASPEEALRRMNEGRRHGAEALAAADRVILTLGTAWVYEHRGEVVANCHRQPASAFVRRRLSVAEIVAAFEELLAGPLAAKEVTLTVSPVRHVGDTLAGNGVSKATLRLAAEELTERHANIAYYPAYEILVDDLRDYRFYADDLVHPAPQAVEYIREHFAATVLTPAAQALLQKVQQITTTAAHRPRNAAGEAHRALCRRMLEEIAALPALDFREEAAIFGQYVEINS